MEESLGQMPCCKFAVRCWGPFVNPSAAEPGAACGIDLQHMARTALHHKHNVHVNSKPFFDSSLRSQPLPLKHF